MCSLVNTSPLATSYVIQHLPFFLQIHLQTSISAPRVIRLKRAILNVVWQDFCFLSTTLGALSYTCSQIRFPFSNTADQTDKQYSASGTVAVLYNGNSIFFSLPEKPSLALQLPVVAINRNSQVSLTTSSQQNPCLEQKFLLCSMYKIFHFLLLFLHPGPQSRHHTLTLFHCYISNASQFYVVMLSHCFSDLYAV